MWRGGPEGTPFGRDEDEGFTDASHATLILVFNLIRGAERGVLDPPRPISDARLYKEFKADVIPHDIPEDDLMHNFYPTITQDASKPWIFVQENEIDPKILSYAIYHEEYNEGRDISHHIVRPPPPPVLNHHVAALLNGTAHGWRTVWRTARGRPEETKGDVVSIGCTTVSSDDDSAVCLNMY